jgi:hypothetical protein
MNIELTRDTDTGVATLGHIAGFERLIYTLERPWLDNERAASCVPAGAYELEPYSSPKHGATWCLRNEALHIFGSDALTSEQLTGGDRSMIEIHAANWPRQLLGCIALGFEQHPMLDPGSGEVSSAVEASADAVAFLLAQIGSLSTGHTLTITAPPPAVARGIP